MGASDIRREINEYLDYLNLVNSLFIGSERRAPIDEIIRSVGEFTSQATSKELRAQSKLLIATLKETTTQSSKFIPRLKSVKRISRDFNELCLKTDVWRFGVPYEWITNRFKASALKWPNDLPPHAKVGIGIHEGKVSVEEMFLLDDTFLLLARAEVMYQNMLSVGSHIKKKYGGSLDEKSYTKLSALNNESCSYSRLCVLSSAAFVEAFVNSVGWAEAQRLGNKANEATIEELKGSKKGKYLSLERKLERFPKLIRLDGKSPIILSDKKQRKEPFITFLSETKELRDSSMHSSPNKAGIWLPPKEWLDLAQRSVKHSLAVAQKFWMACYPERDLPDYLEQLNEESLHKKACERVKLSCGQNYDL